MPKYKVTCSEIEWDVGKPGEYSPKVIAQLPKSDSVVLDAPNKESARQFGLDDISDNNGFLIHGCTLNVELIQEKLNKNDLANIIHCIEKAYPCVVNGGPPPTFIQLHEKVSKLLKEM